MVKKLEYEDYEETQLIFFSLESAGWPSHAQSTEELQDAYPDPRPSSDNRFVWDYGDASFDTISPISNNI